jgi:hypothetical protein
MFILLLETWKGSGAVEGLLGKEGAHFLGCNSHVGNERLLVFYNSGTLYYEIMLIIRPYIFIRNLFSLVDLSPSSGVSCC